MNILTRVAFGGLALLSAFSSPAYPAPIELIEPVAQVYAVQGRVTAGNSAGKGAIEVKKGYFLGREDSLYLDKNSSVSLYFKSGGRKDVRTRDDRAQYKVADLAPRVEAYGQSVPLFGATRGSDARKKACAGVNFFYPQEGIILDAAPLIEFTLFNGSGQSIALGRAVAQIAQAGRILDSREFSKLDYGSAYQYQLPSLDGQAEYKVELKIELPGAAGNALVMSFPLYLTGGSDAAPGSKYAPFSDPVYRSFESASIEHQGKTRTVSLIKQLVKRGEVSSPVVVIELFIP